MKLINDGVLEINRPMCYLREVYGIKDRTHQRKGKENLSKENRYQLSMTEIVARDEDVPKKNDEH